MAIDYIAAPALSELVRTAGVLPASAVRWLAAGTAEALVTLHREGIIHRDVKPQNILLPLTGPRLIDFGISHASDLTRTSLTLGTIAFTSPEQARGEASTAASDVYSLGATLFHLTTGRPPYRADGDTLALLARVQRGELDLDGLPKELVPLIRPCLAVRPTDRPAPADVLDQFRRAMAGLPLSQSGSRWLPPRWTALIEVYERQSHALRRGAAAGPDDLTVDQRTSAVPLPGRTQMYTEDAEAEAARVRAQREREQERERAEKQAAGEQAARLKAERAAEQKRAEQRRQERARKRASSSSAQQPPLSVASVTGPPAKKGSSNGWWLIPLIFFVVAVWRPWESDAGSSSGGSSTSSSSGYTSSSGSSGSSSSGTVADPDPTPDATDAAFRAVSTGDCLTAYDDGYDDWSTGRAAHGVVRRRRRLHPSDVRAKRDQLRGLPDR